MRIIDREMAFSFIAFFCLPFFIAVSARAQLPTGWTALKVGTVEIGTGTSYSSTTGTFTINSSNGSIGGTTDNFQYVYLPCPSTGDFQFVAHFAGSTSTGVAATSQVGIMLRETVGTGVATCRFISNQVNIPALSSTAVSISVNSRDNIGIAGGNRGASFAPIPTIPTWLKLVRFGSQVAIYFSTDGSTWQVCQAGELSTFNASTNVVGLALAAGKVSGTTNVTATFDNVSMTPLTSSFTQPYMTSWLGNDLPGGGLNYVQNFAQGVCVNPNSNSDGGTLYITSNGDENGRPVGIYKNGSHRQDGNYLGSMADVAARFGRTPGAVVACDGSYVYVQMNQKFYTGEPAGFPASGYTWYAIRRYDLYGNVSKWTTGGDGDNSYLVADNLNTTPTSPPVAGVAVYKTAGTTGAILYISDNYAGQIKAYSISTAGTISQTPTSSISVTGCGPIAVNQSDGSIWVIQGTSVLHYSSSGTQITTDTISGLSAPTALTVNPSTGQLLVTDAGSHEQLYFYTINTAPTVPTLSATWGPSGGIYNTTSPGTISDTTWRGINGVSTDSSGNIYVSAGFVAQGACNVYEFDSSGTTLYRYRGLEYEKSGGFDASTGSDVYTTHQHYSLNYSNTNGKEWTWTGYTLDDRGTYNGDMRLHGSGVVGDVGNYLGKSFVRTIGGHKFLFMGDEYGFGVYRFTSGSEIAIPCALFVNSKGATNWPTPSSVNAANRFVWNDTNGDGNMDTSSGSTEFTAESSAFQSDEVLYGWYADTAGGVWIADPKVGIKHYINQGVDSHGSVSYNPTLGSSTAEVYSIPSIFNNSNAAAYVCRAVYIPAVGSGTDTLLITGYTANTGQQAALSIRGEAGAIVVCYHNIPHGSSPLTLPTPAWTMQIPNYRVDANCQWPACIDVPQMQSGAAPTQFILGYYQSCEELTFNLADGSYVGRFVPGPEVAGTVGGLDHPFSTDCIVRSSGEFDMVTEGQFQNKQALYRQTLPSVPATPMAVIQPGPGSSLNQANQVRLDWTGTPTTYGNGVMQYKVYRGTTSGGETLLATTTSPGFIDTPVYTAATTYYYEITAENAAGETSMSSEVSVVLPTTTVANTLKFVANDTTTLGTWIPNGTTPYVYGNDGYNMLGETASYPAYASISYNGWTSRSFGSSSSTSALQVPPTGSTRLEYYDNATRSTIPTVTVNVNADSLNNVHQVAFYCLSIGSTTSNETITAYDGSGISGTALTSQTISNTIYGNGVWLVYNVRGTVTFQFNYNSSTACFSGIFFDPPQQALPSSTPQNLATFNQFSPTLNLNTSAPISFDFFNFKRATTSGGPYSIIGQNQPWGGFADNTSVLNGISGLTAGTTYYYVASQLSQAGEGSNSSEISVTPLLPPNVPTGLTATGMSSTTIGLTWTADSASGVNAGADQYVIYRSTASGRGYAQIGTSTSTSYTDSGLTPTTTYYYVISAVSNSWGPSFYGSQSSAMP